jgi:hypothetical protein
MQQASKAVKRMSPPLGKDQLLVILCMQANQQTLLLPLPPLQVPWDKVFGKDKAPASLGPFTADAELRNGRAAMLGLLALLFIEGSSSQGFFM